jgi:hypothetical protein
MTTASHTRVPVRTLVRRLAASAVLAAGVVALVAPVSAVADEGAGSGSGGSAKASGSGATLAFAPLAPVTGLKPGDSFSTTFAVKNTGDAPATNVMVSYGGTQGLDFAKKFSNCIYEHIPAQDEGPAQISATCDIEETLAPGAVYVPQTPLPFTTLSRALYEGVTVFAQPDSSTFPPGTQQGNGVDPVLRLVEQTPGTGAAYGTDSAHTDVTVDSTADFALTGAQLKGKAGDTVTANLTFANKGPGWVVNDVSQPIAAFEVKIPTGTTVTKVPNDCTADGTAAYRCTTPTIWAGEKTSIAYPFKMKIDKVVADTTGTVSFVKGDHRSGTLPFDHDAADNTAQIVLNGSGTTGGSGTGGASGVPSGVPSGTSGNGSQLAATGTNDTLILSGFAGAVLAIGGGLALSVAARRR